MSGLWPLPWLLAAAGAFGWVWGSFLNTVVDRTPRRDGTGTRLGWFSPSRSVCLGCGAPVSWHDNLPILSFLWLRGRCRACGAWIGWRTLAVEVGTPAAFLALAASLPAMAGWRWSVWGAAALSTGIVAVPLALEGRRVTRVGGVAVALAAIGAALWAAT